MQNPFESIEERLKNIEILMSNLSLKLGNEDIHSEKDEILTIKEAANFLSLSVPTIYGLLSKGELPVMKRSKRCYFSKLDLIDYLKAGRRKTNAEIEVIANKRLTKNS